MKGPKNSVECGVRALTAVLLLQATAIRAVTLDSQGIASPEPPEVVCKLNENDVKVTSFADILGYQFKGTCTVSFPGTNLPPIPAGVYEAGASWTEATGMTNEWLQGKDMQGKPWEMTLGGTCKLDPWMVGSAAANCSGGIGSSSPNAPSPLSVKKLGFPVTPQMLDSQAKGWLTGKTIVAMKNEHQAPKIVEPEEAKVYAGDVPLTIKVPAGDPAKTFLLEWQTKSGNAWVAKPVDSQEAFHPTIKLASLAGSPDWRVRARASQSKKSSWSDWRAFKVATLAPPPCQAKTAYAASYGAASTPATMVHGQQTMVSINLTNLGSLTWTVAGSFHLSYHWVQNGNAVVYDGLRTNLPSDVASCGGATVNASVAAPPSAGTYTLQWDLVQEGVTWFSTQGVPTANRTVTVN